MKKLLCLILTGHNWKFDGATPKNLWYVCKHCGTIKSEANN